MRDRGQLQKEVLLQHCDRMRKLLVTLGCWNQVNHKAFAGRLARDEVTCHDGVPLPPELRERQQRECERLALVQQQLAALEKTRQASVPAPPRQRTDALAHLNGIGEVGASRLALELFWREFSNWRQVGACVALVPQPWDSGESQTDQGISRQGEFVDSFGSPIKIGDYLIESSVSVGVSLFQSKRCHATRATLTLQPRKFVLLSLQGEFHASQSI